MGIPVPSNASRNPVVRLFPVDVSADATHHSNCSEPDTFLIANPFASVPCAVAVSNVNVVIAIGTYTPADRPVNVCGV
jgi:hypothetical protein